MDRREFLKASGLSAFSIQLPARRLALASDDAPADKTIHIGPALIEVGPQRFLSVTAYNGQFPGPLLRLKEGKRTTVDIYNHTDTPEQLHWHGQLLPDSVDGAAEERTPWIPAHGRRRLVFVPGPAGFRFYHTHVHAGSNLDLGQYGGEVGSVYIEPALEARRL
jgi:FtsP/CotA-like multicopper oxidase with cupredoxin domain